MDGSEAHAHCAGLVREGDPERSLAVLYAPADRRDALNALYAFNLELGLVRERVREAMAGEIRLQWWREVVTGEREAGGHPVAEALLDTIERYELPTGRLASMCDARIFDLYDDPMPDTETLEGYCGETACALLQFSARILDADASNTTADAAGHGGCAQAISGLASSLPIHRDRGQCYVPLSVLSAIGWDRESFLAAEDPDQSSALVEAIRGLAADHYDAFRRAIEAVPANVRTAFLPVATVPSRLVKLREAGAAALTQPIRLSPLRINAVAARAAFLGFPKR